mmetsp:Transcript_22237/g.26039  ORF Transcript_22237/g.26039 Transcript_22237/m.26039 type:complete len:222 (+) Transcript_22237:576-1241(+)
MPAFTIFLDQWPWIAAYILIALGAYMLIFGRQHFERVVKILSACFLFAVLSCLLSINGYFEQKIEEGPSAVTVLIIFFILLLGVVLGFSLGAAMPNKFSLVFICILDAAVLSMVIYSFLMSFTGTWVVLLVSTIIFSVICTILPLKFSEQMRIQSTAFLGAWMLTRGVSLMVGGYPNELQTISWLHNGYVVPTSNFFFVYLVSIAVLYLIGQRTQRAQWAS